MKLFKINSLLAVLIALFLFSACSKDDNGTSPGGDKDEYVTFKFFHDGKSYDVITDQVLALQAGFSTAINGSYYNSSDNLNFILAIGITGSITKVGEYNAIVSVGVENQINMSRVTYANTGALAKVKVTSYSSDYIEGTFDCELASQSSSAKTNLISTKFRVKNRNS
jgi:hypothetical protein